jgi:lipopolysaccharide export system protein LptA
MPLIGHLKALMGISFAVCLAGLAAAQGAPVSFGFKQQNSSKPIEITSEELQIDQAGGFALFIGNVIVGQGDLRMTADRMRVEYGQNPETKKTDITVLTATGGVTIVSGEEAAEADMAVYSIADTTIVMTGDVLLTQGPSAISGDKMTYNLTTDTGFMEGRVKTVLQTGDQ